MFLARANLDQVTVKCLQTNRRGVVDSKYNTKIKFVTAFYTRLAVVIVVQG
jgi:hypothetical protein